MGAKDHGQAGYDHQPIHFRFLLVVLMFKDVLSLTLLCFRVSQTTKAVTSVLVVGCGERRICLMCGRRAAAAARPTAAAAEEPPDDGPLANDVVLRASLIFGRGLCFALSVLYQRSYPPPG